MVNDKAMWNIFLGGLNRTARTHYRDRRTCFICNNPIIDSNRLGLCKKCRARPGTHKRGESANHRTLKRVARKLLKEMGCVDICEEYYINHRYIDVLGVWNDGRRIAIECGGSNEYHLRVILGTVDELYILPYGQTEVFRWNANINICKLCGHKV